MICVFAEARIQIGAFKLLFQAKADSGCQKKSNHRQRVDSPSLTIAIPSLGIGLYRFSAGGLHVLRDLTNISPS